MPDIILHTCMKNYDQMIYSSWDIVRDGRKKWHIVLFLYPHLKNRTVQLTSGSGTAYKQQPSFFRIPLTLILKATIYAVQKLGWLIPAFL